MLAPFSLVNTSPIVLHTCQKSSPVHIGGVKTAHLLNMLHGFSLSHRPIMDTVRHRACSIHGTASLW